LSLLNTHKSYLDFSIPNYPPRNKSKNFEAYFYDYFKDNKFDTDYIYIPVQWTNYLISKNYGKNIEELKKFIHNNLEANKKYFTIVQYAGGPLVTMPNTLIFSMGGTFNTKNHKTSKVIPLPLIYDGIIEKRNNKKNYLASYIGRPTHDIRLKVEKKLNSIDNFFIKNLDSMDSTIGNRNLNLFTDMINQSHFSICPRGFGPTSFRLYESIKAGTIPIYITDKFFLPFKEFLDWQEFSVLLKPRKISSIPKIVDRIINSGDIDQMNTNLKDISRKYFNFQYMSEYIKSIVEE
tara:strand:- start:47 stop:922 length:876 start_codon:yes stop_codon:yes gene_type:complete